MKQHVVLVAQVEALLQVAIVGHEDASLSLDGLGNKGAHLVAIFVEGTAQGLHVVIRNTDEARRQRTILGVGAGVVAHGDDGHGAAMEVAVAADDFDLIVADAFLHGTPTASQLQGSLNAFGTRVHGQDAVVAEEVVHELLILAEGIVVESARGEAEHVGLVFQGFYDAGVAVALVHGRIGGEEVEIFLSFHIPHVDAFTLVQHYGQGVVVVGTIALFQIHKTLTGCLVGCCFFHNNGSREIDYLNKY